MLYCSAGLGKFSLPMPFAELLEGLQSPLFSLAAHAPPALVVGAMRRQSYGASRAYFETLPTSLITARTLLTSQILL